MSTAGRNGNGRRSAADPAAADAATTDHEGEVHDFLADLFLDGPGGAGSVPSAQPNNTPDSNQHAEHAIEFICTRGLGSAEAAMVRAYGRTLARSTDAPVAIVFLGARSTSVELVGGTLPVDHIPESDATAEVLIDLAAPLAGQVLIAASSVSVLRSALSGAARRTVLGAADERGVIVAYRALKEHSMHARDDGHEDIGAITLVMAARDGSKCSEAAGRRVCSTALRFLGTEPVLTQIESPDPLSNGHGPASMPTQLVGRGPAVTPGRAAQLVRAAWDAFRDTDAASNNDPGASHIPGLVSLDLWCPWAREVELARDEEGGLHLVVPWSAGAAEALLAAESWARSHTGMLSRVRPEVAADAEPVGHVIAESAGPVRRLLGGRIRVHVAARSADGAIALVDLTAD